jgi:hypothetical protein
MFSVCAQAAQIESLSVENGVLRATISGDDVAVYAADYEGALLSDVFFEAADDNGYVEINVGDKDELTVYLWNKETLSPLSLPYSVKDGRATVEGSDSPIPAYSSYEFDQTENIVIVKSVSDELITGWQSGVEKDFPITKDVTVVGISDDFADVVPGSVILPSVPQNGKSSAVELIASIGIPVNSPDVINESLGVRSTFDNFDGVENVFSRFYRWSNATSSTPSIQVRISSGSDLAVYTFSKNCPVYKFNIETDESDNPVYSLTTGLITTKNILLGSSYYNYIYMRYNENSGLVSEAVVYSVPRNYDPGAGGDGWTNIFCVNE